MDDDLFGDLLGNGVKSSQATKVVVSPSLRDPTKEASNKPRGPQQQQAQLRPAIDLIGSGSDAASTQDGGKDAVGSTPAQGFNKEELETLITTTVQSAVNNALGKFVASLRTVLEDMSRKIEANSAGFTDLRHAFEEIQDLLDAQTGNAHARFTSVDLAIKEVERGVQALRDKQELHEAQALLAKLTPHPEPAPPAAATSSDKSQPAPAAVAPTPAPAAPAPTLVQSAPAAPPSPAPVPAAVPMHPAVSAALPGAPSAVPAAPALASAPAPAPYSQPPGPPEPHQYGPQQPPPLPYQGLPQPPPAVAPPPGTGPSRDPYQMPPPALQQPPSQGQPPFPTYQQNPPLAPPLHAPGPPPPHHQSMGPPPMSMPPPSGPPPPHMLPPPAPGLPIPSPQGPVYPSHSLSSYPPPPVAPQPMYPPPFRPQLSPQHSGGSFSQGPPAGHPPQGRGGIESRTTSRAVPLEQIIHDISNMGFERHQVMAVVNSLEKSGQAVDLNVILDRLTNGRY